MKKIYVDKDSFPFLEWWGYNNVVWQRKEELPIIIGLLFDIEGYDVYFETNFTGTGGKPQEYDLSSDGKTVINEQRKNLIKETRIRMGLEAKLLDIIQEIQMIGIGNQFYNSAKISYEIWGDEDWKTLAPVIRRKKNKYSENIYNVASEKILFTLNKLLILYPLNIRSMKNPQPLKREETPENSSQNHNDRLRDRRVDMFQQKSKMEALKAF